MICPACAQKSWGILYQGLIRDGSFGKLTRGRVYQCLTCKLGRLENFFEEYDSTAYRDRYNDTSNANELLDMHDHEQGQRVAQIGFERLRGKLVLDYGCGHGAFLDAVAGVARATIGIEPMQSMRADLERRGHMVCASGSAALADYRGRVDVLTSFGVIEHVDDPAAHLRDAFDLLAPNGILFLQTDNLDDILLKSGAVGFESFFYRTAHNWYFSRSNLEALARKAGFSNLSIKTSHGYDFSNFLLWHKEARPTGTGKLKLFDPAFEACWKATVEAAGLGELITLQGVV